jgi:hypothetical protein
MREIATTCTHHLREFTAPSAFNDALCKEFINQRSKAASALLTKFVILTPSGNSSNKLTRSLYQQFLHSFPNLQQLSLLLDNTLLMRDALFSLYRLPFLSYLVLGPERVPRNELTDLAPVRWEDLEPLLRQHPSLTHLF